MKPTSASVSVEALGRLDLFKGLSSPALAEVRASGRLRSVAKGKTIFAQGDQAKACHALIKGRVRIAQSDEDGGQLIMRFIGPGQMFGTMALFTDRKYPAEAQAVTDSLEISWPESALLNLIKRHPGIALNIIAIIGTRIREVQERLRELATQRVERRIAHTILRLAEQAGLASGGTMTIDFPLTRRDLAEMCGTTLHNASRILTAWERRNLVATSKRRLMLRDREAIRQIAYDLV